MMSTHNLLKNLLDTPPLTKNTAVELIRKELQSDAPSMIARFGATEIKAIIYSQLPSVIRFCIGSRIKSRMYQLSGFFPETEEAIFKFSELMFNDMKLLDILGSWRIEEKLLLSHFPSAQRVELQALEPYLSSNPWSELLENRKVLVVHPFNQTIEQQYQKREYLFQDKRVLPQFQTLETVKAVQTIAGNKSEFTDWFAALDSMKAAIDTKDYEIAILGCGAYGFPLAAHIKRMGKKAIHMGGPTQLLFGIKGRRWDNHPQISNFYNDYWVRPNTKETPSNTEKVEGACYW